MSNEVQNEDMVEDQLQDEIVDEQEESLEEAKHKKKMPEMAVARTGRCQKWHLPERAWRGGRRGTGRRRSGPPACSPCGS